MKAFKILPFALASLALGACSSDDIAGNDGSGSDDPRFLAVNLSGVSETPGSRAEYDQNGGTYEDGTDAESKINNARFFLFNSDGTPYILINNKSYVDASSLSDQGEDHGTTVETKTEAVLVINGQKQTAPASIIAVINYDACPLFTADQTNPTLSQLKATLKSTTFKDDTKGFVMSNSVYAQAGQVMCETSVAGHIATDADAAKANPVDIYVERVVGKATVSIDDTNSTWTKTQDGAYRTKVGEYQGNPVYAVVLGWGVADQNSEANIEKQIGNNNASVDFTNTSLGINPWNTADYHRCFWEAAPLGENAPINFKFNEYNQAINTGYAYMLPNTPTTATWATDENVLYKQETDLSKILVATRLEIEKTDAETKVTTTENAEICEYMGIQYLGEDNVKTAIVNYYPKYYVSSDATTFTSISPDMIVFKTAEEIEGVNTGDVRDYHVIPQLKLENGQKLYTFKDASVTNPTADDLVETSLSEFNGTNGLAKNIHFCQIRKGGLAYYFTPIRHLAAQGNDLGAYGVVRNHSYKVTLNSISGFGTPVYDPDKKIIQPEVPTNENTYLAATIKALSWRVVKSTVDLDKTK